MEDIEWPFQGGVGDSPSPTLSPPFLGHRTLSSIRHSVELFLKYILYDLRILNDGLTVGCLSEKIEPIQGHNVLGIFENNKGKIVNAFETEPTSGFHWHEWMYEFELIIKAVNKIDSSGQAIRYPADLKLNPNMGGTYQVSTKHLAVCIQKIRSVYEEYDERDC